MIGFRKEQLALPREARQSNGFNGLRNSLDKKRLVVFQGVSEGIRRAMQPAGINCDDDHEKFEGEEKMDRL